MRLLQVCWNVPCQSAHQSLVPELRARRSITSLLCLCLDLLQPSVIVPSIRLEPVLAHLCIRPGCAVLLAKDNVSEDVAVGHEDNLLLWPVQQELPYRLGSRLQSLDIGGVRAGFGGPVVGLEQRRLRQSSSPRQLVPLCFGTKLCVICLSHQGRKVHWQA